MKLYRAIATVGGMTMISRVLGFARDMLIAGVIGSGPVADAFFVAFRFPNLFRRLFAEGAFNSAFVPLFAKRLEGEGEAAARSFAEQAMAWLVAMLLVLTIAAEIAMPWLMYLLAPGFADDPAKFDLTVLLTRIAFPYLLCMALVALLSGILNSMQKYAAAAAAPILLNIVLIIVMCSIAYAGFGNTPSAGIALAWGVAAAGVLQLAVLMLSARRAGMALRLRPPERSEGMSSLLRLGIPGVVAGGITQLNIAIGTIIASLQAGAVSHLYYADRIYQLPLGVVGIAIGVVLLPEISRRLRAGDATGVSDSQNRALEFALMLTLPAAAALAVSAEPISRVLYERGQFLPADSRATAWALAAYAAGLPAFVLIKVFQPAFFAREDTRTPMRYAAVNLGINVSLSLALFFLFRSLGFMPHVGIALATSVAAWINVALLWGTLSQRGYFTVDDRARRAIPLCALAAVIMAIGLWAIQHALWAYFDRAAGPAVQFAALAFLVAAGMGLYGLFGHLTGAIRLAQIRAAMRR